MSPAAAPLSVAAAAQDDLQTLPCEDSKRLGALLSRLEPRLRAVAQRFTRDPDTARDVVQNAFEKVLRHCRQFRGRSKPSTWMHRIVANEALMYLRSERRRSGRAVELIDWEQAALADPAPSAPELIERRALREKVRQGLAVLRPEEREVLERCAIDGVSYQRYSEEVGIHPAAAKSRAFRARRRLGALLERV